MRLLILTPEFSGSGGGIVTFYRYLAPALRDVGVSIRVLEGSAFNTSSERHVRSVEGVTVERLEADRVGVWWARLARMEAMPGLRRHLAAAWAMWEQSGRGGDADVIEATDWGLSFVPPAIEGAALVVQLHGSIGQIASQEPILGEDMQSALTGLIESNLLSQVPCVQTYSFANAAFWKRETRRGIEVIRPAWREGSVPRVEVSERGLVLGRIQKWKGPQVLCEALGKLGTAAPPLDWVGRDTTWGATRRSASFELAQMYPAIWGAVLRPLPQVDQVKALALQAAARFNVVPSTWDVFNFTAVEAMASGRPAIVSEGAGASELIEDGRNGYLFPAEDAPALADRIRKVVSASPDELRRVGGAAQETVRTHLDPARVAEARLGVYRSVRDSPRTDPRAVLGWAADACRSEETHDFEPMEFLSQFGVRDIGRHLLRRLDRKARRRLNFERGAL